MIKKIIILILFTTMLFSNVNIKASKTFVNNENIYFELEAFGNNIKFPKIEKIDNFTVQEAGQSRSISNINGKITNKIIKRYVLRANKDFTIPSFSILVDGIEEQTKILHIKKEIIQKTKSTYFDLNISLNKKELFVGEQSILTMTFKYKEGLQIINSSLSHVDFKDFWFKNLASSKSYKEGDYIIQNVKYILFAQKEGLLHIEPLRVDISILDKNSNEFFAFQREAKTLNIYSNSLDIKVKSLVKNISLIGDFNISASVDKEEILQGEAVSYKLKIEGFGNIDDLDDIKLNIKDLTIYENKASITNEIKNELYFATYKKSFSILGNEDFIIPSISISYFDKKLKKVIKKKTKSFKIKVKGKIKKEIKLQKSTSILDSKKITKEEHKITVEISLFSKVLFFILGIVFTLGILLLYLYFMKKNNKKEELHIVKKAKKAMDSKSLIRCLLPYLNKNEHLDSLIFKLEKSDKDIYPKLKKEIIELLKEFK